MIFITYTPGTSLVDLQGDIDEEFEIDEVGYFGFSDGTILKVDGTRATIRVIHNGKGTGIVLGQDPNGLPAAELKASITACVCNGVLLIGKAPAPVQVPIVPPTATPKVEPAPVAVNPTPPQRAVITAPTSTSEETKYLSHDRAQDLINRKKIPYNTLIEEPVQDLGTIEMVKGA